jgi:hypothetical protein
MHRAIMEKLAAYHRSRNRPEQILKQKLYRTLNRIYPFLSIEETTSGEDVINQIPVRVTSRCNQDCPFCQAVPPEPEDGPALSALEQALDRVTRIFPNSKVVLTGGEPTLRKDLPELCRYLVDLDTVKMVEIQTNAILIGSSPERFTLKPSKKLRFLVAMHGLSPSVYNRCTDTEGQFASACRGTNHLLETGHPVEFNCVVNSLNIDHLDEYVTSIPGLFKCERGPAVHFSVMGIPEHRDAASYHVRYTQLLLNVVKALELAETLGVAGSAALSAGHASVPLCLLGKQSVDISEYPRMYEHEGLEAEDPTRWWVKPGQCRECAVNEYCLGLPKSYADRFGFDELRPIRYPGAP